MEYKYGAEELNRILDEVSGFEVQLVEDPTLPQHGSSYLQKILSTLRTYSNRLMFYIQVVGKQEKNLKVDVRTREMDLEFKISELISEDEIVRQGPSIEDRKAIAVKTLESEHSQLKKTRALLLDTQETMKLLRMKHKDLQQTSQDIRLQRQIVKDDKDGWESGLGGYSAPQKNKDNTVPDGMTAPVRPKLDPKDLLDPDKRPADLPAPVDMVHAAQIAAFFDGSPVTPPSPSEKKEEPKKESEKPTGTLTYDDLLQD